MKRKLLICLIIAALSCGCAQAPDPSQPAETTASSPAAKAPSDITKAGSYIVTDSTPITVNAPDSEVELVLQNANIVSKNQPAIYIKAAKKVIITAPEGTKNSLTTSCDKSDDSDNKLSTVIFSKADVEICGTGELSLNSEKGLGIKCKQSLSIKEVTLDILSARSSVSADTVSVNSGNINIGNGGKKDKGKGIKADSVLSVNGGELTIESTDDALHSNKLLSVNGGSISISTDDDALHAKQAIAVGGGNISVTRCNEGLEAPSITVNDGIIDVIASDDGFNATKGDGKDTFMHGDTSLITINGGKISVTSKGDGLDSNGSIVMNGGEVLVIGPDSDGDSALDFDGTFTVNGGFLTAYGSAGMAQAPQGGSVNSLSITADFTADGKVTVTDQNGAELFSLTPPKDCRNLVISDDSIKTGDTLTVTIDGTEAGTAEITSSITYIGERSGFGGFGGFGGQRPDFENGDRPDFDGRKKPDFKNDDFPDFGENFPPMPEGELPDFGNIPDFGNMPDFDKMSNLPQGEIPAPPKN